MTATGLVFWTPNTSLWEDGMSIFLMYLFHLSSSVSLGGLSNEQRGFHSPRFFIGACLAVLGLFPPWYLSHPFVRAFFTITSLLYIVRNMQMGLDPRTSDWPIATRILQTIWHFDHRDASPIHRYFSWHHFHRALAFALPTFLCYRLFVLIPSEGPWFLVKCVVSLYFFSFLMHGFDAYLQWQSALFHGFIHEVPLMREPHLSKSLSEFWGKRWNTVMQMNLAGLVYRPLRGKAPRATRVFLTFVASGFLHIYPLFVAGLEPLPILMHFSFFLLQGALVLFENACFPQHRSFAWPFFAIALPSPLLLVPLLEFSWW